MFIQWLEGQLLIDWKPSLLLKRLNEAHANLRSTVLTPAPPVRRFFWGVTVTNTPEGSISIYTRPLYSPQGFKLLMVPCKQEMTCKVVQSPIKGSADVADRRGASLKFFRRTNRAHPNVQSKPLHCATPNEGEAL